MYNIFWHNICRINYNIESITEAIRYEVEACDSLLGFHLFHSLGGRTSSGLGSLILNEIRDEYPDQIISTFSIFPSKKS